MKKVLAVLLAAAVVCAASFFRLNLFRTPTLKDPIRLEPEEVEEICVISYNSSWKTRERGQIREILDYLNRFPCYGKFGLPYNPDQGEICGGFHGLQIVENDIPHNYPLFANMIAINGIWYVGEDDYFRPLLDLVGSKAPNKKKMYS